MAVVPTFASPNPGNYSVGRGYLAMKLLATNELETDEPDFIDMGNVAACEFLVKPTLLTHFNTRYGIRKKDLVVVTELDATLTFSLEEITARNMGIAMLGTVGASGGATIRAFTRPLLYAALEFTGTNTVGADWLIEFPLVTLSPAKPVAMISQGSGSWASIDMQGDVLQDPATGEYIIATSSSFT